MTLTKPTGNRSIRSTASDLPPAPPSPAHTYTTLDHPARPTNANTYGSDYEKGYNDALIAMGNVAFRSNVPSPKDQAPIQSQNHGRSHEPSCLTDGCHQNCSATTCESASPSGVSYAEAAAITARLPQRNPSSVRCIHMDLNRADQHPNLRNDLSPHIRSDSPEYGGGTVEVLYQYQPCSSAQAQASHNNPRNDLSPYTITRSDSPEHRGETVEVSYQYQPCSSAQAQAQASHNNPRNDLSPHIRSNSPEDAGESVGKPCI